MMHIIGINTVGITGLVSAELFVLKFSSKNTEHVRKEPLFFISMVDLQDLSGNNLKTLKKREREHLRLC